MTRREKQTTPPCPGYGLRLRTEYLETILHTRPELDCIEVISENYLDADEQALQQLERLKERYPLLLHGISLSIGNPWPLDPHYLDRLKKLIERIEPLWISDHLGWRGADAQQGELLPMPYSEETLEHLVTRVNEVQSFLGRQILLENVPMEQNDGEQEIPEAEFIREVAERSDSLVLIDIGNLLTSSLNQGFDTSEYINRLPRERVQQIHLPDISFQPGTEDECDAPPHLIDPIWQLYTRVLDRFGRVTTVIEREDTIPTLAGMLCDIKKVRRAVDRYLASD
ncbi:DUF692 domain-containing protein [Sedimenticola thiotaurini]|uniref:DUF692 domain-containing protein n=1 Tax=Sedimenticola thiotaurini TaxID=1543721 RepID=A0A0F7JXG4_9GAMM|nr:DUF692 domain-containing protein [Sedimenticola thiotaurini]AKH20357.1 hypothetical protein AAY24_08340 [Sedimenticola thiotaurini]